jgi:single-stranded-DNA-specific exonuclease
MAVGITVAKENLDTFRGELNLNCGIGDDALTPRERIDVCLEPDDVTMALINDIALLEPFGRSNEKPVFALKGMAVEYASLIGAKRNVIKLKLRQAAPRAENRGQYGRQAIDAVFFGDTGLFLDKLNLTGDGGGSLVVRGSPRRTVDLTFHPEINDYNGVRKLQLIIRSVRNSINC